jgi:methionine biosynthesis protein MetW
MLKKAQENLQKRQDLMIIADIIPPKSKVLDLGCGNGDLLHILKEKKDVYACGVEISQEKILECVNKGVSVIHGDLNNGLGEFLDSSFDFVVLSQTIQAVQRPDKLLDDMMRIGKTSLVSFMNIGFWQARFQLFFKGTMPVTATLPHKWYNTPNIHLATIKDFKNLCREKNIKIRQEIPFGDNLNFAAKLFPNLFAPTCVFCIEKL